MYLRDSFVESFRRIYVNEKIIYIRECVSIFTCIYMLCVREGGRVLARKTMKKGNDITNLNSVKLQPLVIFYLRIEYTVLWQGYSWSLSIQEGHFSGFTLQKPSGENRSVYTSIYTTKVILHFLTRVLFVLVCFDFDEERFGRGYAPFSSRFSLPLQFPLGTSPQKQLTTRRTCMFLKLLHSRIVMSASHLPSKELFKGVLT